LCQDDRHAEVGVRAAYPHQRVVTVDVAVNGTAPAPIAIVGIGCRLAGDVHTPEQFWSFLLAGGSAVGQVPADRWAPYLQRDPRNAAVLRETTPWGSFLDDLAGFDAEFFGVSPSTRELRRARSPAPTPRC
jgi:6-methylsalicylic acid synthase